MSESYAASRRRRGTTFATQQSLPSVGASSTGNVWVDPTVAESVDLTFRLAPPYAQIAATSQPSMDSAPNAAIATTPTVATASQVVFDVATAHHHQAAASRSASAMTRRVFVEQQGGTFLHATADRAAKKQRSEQAGQEQWLANNANLQNGTMGAAWTRSDDARLFAHFLARIIVRLNHMKRMIVSLCAGVSLCLLLVLFQINTNAQAFTATPIYTADATVVPNATAVVGAYGGQCDPEVQASGQCTTLLLQASIYKWSSYFYHASTMLCCILALLAFAADCALASSSRIAVFSTPAVATLPKAAASPLSGRSIASTEGGSVAVGIATQQQQLQNRPTRQYTALWRLVGRHLAASSFPLLVVAFCATLACESVEIGRRTPRDIVTLQHGLAQREVVATVLRAACLIGAWLVTVLFHSFSDQTILDEIVHHDSVESLEGVSR